MHRIFLAALVLILLPTSAFAASTPATFGIAQTLLSASSSPGNAYFAGASVVSTAPVAGDLSALGGSVVIAAPVAGDVLLFAGSAKMRTPVAGDLRAIGGNVDIEGPVTGDLVALGYTVQDSGRTGGSVFIIAANTTLSNGASGSVTIYGNNVMLSGSFTGNVDVVATGRLALAASTTIRGALSYEAPVPATIPASAVVEGGINYTSASYLPDVGTSRILAFMSIGFFLVVRILGALILAGLLAGLFPKIAETVVERAYRRRPSTILLTMLLGFAILVATPVMIMMLALTFVGIGLALLLFVLYALLVMLSFLYAGILLGGLLARRFAGRETVRWHDGMLGMLVLSLVSLLSVFGMFLVSLLMLFSAGTLLSLFFHFAFPREDQASGSV